MPEDPHTLQAPHGVVTEVAAPEGGSVRGDVLRVLKQYWGYETLRPMQGAAIDAALAGRDSLVVMPTGGGKSLCYQVPALLSGGLTVVVSPLIALMHDQVEGLRLAGVPAGALNSHTSREDAQRLYAQVREGELSLLYVAPERLLTASFLTWLAKLDAQRGLRAFAIDEAHCISQWGHDFRPEYRQLAELREVFPRTPVHAFTATATPRVREDIAAQLHLRQPAVLVGTFDRPNLTYRVLPRTDLAEQCLSILRRRKGEAAIVYCISRKDTERLADDLTRGGVRAKAYHAGLSPVQRERVQRDFLSESLGVVVATVAFGMGIDRGDVRCVIHAALPKTVEHYQQETGRAGRDGLPSECVLLCGAGDAARWLKLMERGAEESSADAASIREGLLVQRELLEQMQRLCAGSRCRHQALSEYFGQAYDVPAGGCGACDVCLGELSEVPDSPTIARKILSCVFRVQERFGAGHIADVLRGARTRRVLELGHDALTTFGLLHSMDRAQVVLYIQQLADAGLLRIEDGTMPVLRLTDASRPVLRGEAGFTFRTPRLADATTGRPAPAPGRAPASAMESMLSPRERELFAVLRTLRRDLAKERSVPAYVVFSDVTILEMVRARPRTPEQMLAVRGVGQAKLRDFGEAFMEAIDAFERGGAPGREASEQE